MKPAFKLVSIVTSLTVLATIAPSNVSAGPIALAYQGRTYETVHNDPLMEGEYTKAMRVTGWIQLADPLTANRAYSFDFFGASADGLMDFSFSDGLLVHSSEQGTDYAAFSFVTDSTAHIVDWLVYINDTLGQDAPIGGSDIDFSSSLRGDSSSSVCDNCDEPRMVWHGFDSSRVGRWREVPEPASSTLLLLGLAGLGVARTSRRRSKNQDYPRAGNVPPAGFRS